MGMHKKCYHTSVPIDQIRTEKRLTLNVPSNHFRSKKIASHSPVIQLKVTLSK